MDVLATYGFMVAAAVSCGLLAVLPCLVWLMGLSELSYKIPGPWEPVAQMTTIAVPVVAAVGAAVLVGPSTDLVNFIRAVGGVLAGLATFLGIQMAGIPNEPRVYTLKLNGQVWTGADALLHQNDAFKGTKRLGWEIPRAWRPSPTFIARFALFVCIVPPVAGVVVALLIAEWM